jgi:AraC family transcriptional regulator of adaptative response / DNA-3-methyladenine glycosylase II
MILSQPDQRARLLEGFFAREPGLDGSFLVGVTSTGIYCLPSCPARKPKPENVVLIEERADALALGLRACKRCRPDLFILGVDLDEERMGELADELHAAPGEFSDVSDLAARAGVGRTKLTELARAHFHCSPANLLLEAKLAQAARDLALTGRRVLDVALDAGFEGASAFHGNFRSRFGVTPKAYRELGKTKAGELVDVELPLGFNSEDLLNYMGRDRAGVCERRAGSKLEKGILLNGRAARLELVFGPSRLRYAVRAPGKVSASMRYTAHGVIVRLLGLIHDPETFERRAVRAGHRRLIANQRGARMALSASPFEALLWAIVGQQVNLSFASTCRARLIELAGVDAGRGLLAHPGPEHLAAFEPQDLLPLKLSGRKAEYVVGTSRALASGRIDLDAFASRPVGVITRELLALRGIGPWTVRYQLMRGYGMADCVPVGDSALATALQRYFDLNERPKAAEQERLLEPFAPHRTLASYHFWKSLQTT